ncbi:hypothetical protein CLAN_1625 [Campylobacter lanienae NCTC 13004]|uniref:DUF262 domain-containing protein n=1 Tax=Campylobacter lanienae NCTC 13004 TaxID=1031753 RepID=A0A1X9SQ08_9BACT|nr:DUF262 domain-containing protein [Campylobacter lanienae]ARQ98333.1 hypothetical protein CLAN_1625 [Campylobacter lanienae NCTC 13004]
MPQNDVKTLNEICNKILRIPDYQRGYSWGEKQRKDFWKDLISIKGEQKHYTGTISLEKIEQKVWEKKEEYNQIKGAIKEGDGLYYVVDGQQRLTTIFILLNELLNLAISKNLELDDSPSNELKSRWILKQSDGKDPVFFFCYEKKNDNYGFMTNNIFEYESNKDKDATNLYAKNLKEAKDFFKEKIKNLSDKDLNTIFTKLKNKLSFSVYIIENEEDVYITFESMNNRGKPLSTLELLKNRLLYLITLINRRDNGEQNEPRININDRWAEIYRNLGKDIEYPLNDDEFLKDHWLVYYGEPNKGKKEPYKSSLLDYKFYIGKVYGEKPDTTEESENNTRESDDIDDGANDGQSSKSNYESNTNITKLEMSDINEYADKIGEFSKYWAWTWIDDEIKLICSSLKLERLKNIIFRLNMLKMRHFRPLIASIFLKLDNGKLNISEACDFLEIVEKYIFLTFVFGKEYTSHEITTFQKLNHEFYTDKTELSKIKLEFQNRIEQEKVKHTEQFIQRIRDIFNKDENKGFYTWDGCRYFLYEYERELFKEKHGGKMFLNKEWWSKNKSDEGKTLTIEHIYPQTPKENDWNEFDNFDDKDKNILRNLLGNLLPIANSENIKLGNHDFLTKCLSYKKDCYSAQDIEKNYQVWNADIIYKRSKSLIDFMKDHWGIEFSEEQEHYLIHGKEKPRDNK